ncbi:MAG: hypothetical protein IIA72_23480 [Proteobacteria bacterium]|nr:hypothetical protein [Pseudomonadota bacterium]
MFRRKVDEKNAEAAAKAALQFLTLQIELSRSRASSGNGIEDTWARGYLLGTLDAAFQAFEVEQESEHGISTAVTVISLITSLDKHKAEEFYWRGIELQGDPEFSDGMKCGGTEMTKALNGETAGILGLGAFLRDGIKR